MSQVDELIELAREIASAIPDFQRVRGPGVGDHATLRFMTELRHRAKQRFGEDFSERRICGDTGFAVDFYMPADQTIVEVALGLPNPASEFEKDILKAIIAQELGHAVSRLVFISRAGAARKCEQPGRLAVRGWAKTNHQLEIEVHELPGTPRRRRSRKERMASRGKPPLPAS